MNFPEKLQGQYCSKKLDQPNSKYHPKNLMKLPKKCKTMFKS